MSEKNNSGTPPEKQRFKVSAIVQDYNRWYYVIEAFGAEHRIKMFDFQKKAPKPDEIMCLIKTAANGQRVISQDLAPLVASRYKIGNEYDFKVKESHERSGQFDAMTPEGFIFHIDSGKNALLQNRQTIRGRVRSINGIKVNVEPIGACKDQDHVSFANCVAPRSILDIAKQQGAPDCVITLARLAFNNDPAFFDARKLFLNSDSDWLPATMRIACDRLHIWLQGSIRNHRLDVLEHIRRLCIDMLERSSLATGEGHEQENLRSVIADTIKSTETYRIALAHVDAGTAVTFAEDTIASLSRTGYIYEPETRLRTLMAVFALQPDLMDSYMPEVISTLTSGDASNWRRDPLRQALVHMLLEYVRLVRSRADYVMDIELGDNKALITCIVKALAIVLLLTAETQNDINRHLCFSSLCRYASFINEQLSQPLNDRAYSYLFGKLPQIPFSWSDLTSSNVGIICFKLSSCVASSGCKDMIYYEGKDAIVSVHEKSLTIMPHKTITRLHNVLPNWLLPWKDTRVLVAYYENVENDVRPADKDTQKFNRLWRGVQDCFFSSAKAGSTSAISQPPSLRQAKTSIPDIGETVTIRIVSKDRKTDDSKNPIFHCVIEDEQFSGKGYITPRDIVHYNVTTADVSDFTSEDGKPLLLEAVVDSIDANDYCHFTMRDDVDAFVPSLVEEGEELLCKMTIRTGAGDQLLISERGFSLKIPADFDAPELHQGEMAFVIVNTVFDDGKVEAEYNRPTIERSDAVRVADRKCFSTLLRSFSHGVYEEQQDEEYEQDDTADEQRQAQIEMERDEARELMNILDRQSMLSNDRVLSFNYLALARTIAQTIEDNLKANEFNQRMLLIDMMQQYAINHKLDAEEFKRFYLDNEKVLAASHDLNDLATRILCISLLGKPGADEILLKKMKENADTPTGEIAELALAYNIANRHHVKTAAHDISACINAKLAVSFHDQTELQHMGEESPTLEFKASLVFPSGNGMRADRVKQATHILQRAAGMMNGKGGQILIGVNDQGYAVGLATDMKQFSDGHDDYDEQSCRDKMDRFLRDMQLKLMPREANDYMDTRFESHKGKTIYVLDITPSLTPIAVDGVFFRRYGTSTRVMTEEEVRHMRLTRQ